MNNLKNLLTTMLKTKTGSHMLDSGDAYGRHWERNQTIDFESQPEIIIDGYDYTISLFHYLKKALSLDPICEEFNKLKCKDWDSDVYGISQEQKDWLSNNYDVEFKDSFNSYNGNSSLSQVIQGTYLTINGFDYILLQIHNGCDVRGGYTDAKLFALEDEWLLIESVYGNITLEDGKIYNISNIYDGYNLRIDDEDFEDINEQKLEDLNLKGKITLYLGIY